MQDSEPLEDNVPVIPALSRIRQEETVHASMGSIARLKKTREVKRNHLLLECIKYVMSLKQEDDRDRTKELTEIKDKRTNRSWLAVNRKKNFFSKVAQTECQTID